MRKCQYALVVTINGTTNTDSLSKVDPALLRAGTGGSRKQHHNKPG